MCGSIMKPVAGSPRGALGESHRIKGAASCLTSVSSDTAIGGPTWPGISTPRPGAKLVAVSDVSEKRLAMAQNHLSFHQGDEGPAGAHPVQGRGRRGHRHAGLRPLRDGQGGAPRGEAHLRREALHLDERPGPGAHRPRGQEEPQDHGRPHLPLHGRRQEDQGGHRFGRAGQAPLLRLGPGQPGALPARRQRHLGPGPPRPLHHGLRHRQEARRPGGPRLRPLPGRFRGHRLCFGRIRGQRLHRPFPRQLAQPGQDPPDPDQRRQEDARLGRPRRRRKGQDLRPGRRRQERERRQGRHPRSARQLPVRRRLYPQARGAPKPSRPKPSTSSTASRRTRSRSTTARPGSRSSASSKPRTGPSRTAAGRIEL